MDAYLDDDDSPFYVAYVELFTKFHRRAPGLNHGLHSIKRELKDNGERVARLIPVANIVRSVHLIPRFGPTVPTEWTSATVLDLAAGFFINTFSDRHLYYLLG